MEKVTRHHPVLLNEVLTGLKVRPGARFIDGTLGGGGHTKHLLLHSRAHGPWETTVESDEWIEGPVEARLGAGPSTKNHTPSRSLHPLRPARGETPMLKNRPRDGRVLGFDVDPAAIRRVRKRLSDDVAAGHLRLAQANFDQMDRIARQQGFTGVDGILLDLGLSSFQLDSRTRGFAFQHNGPLDMRFDPSDGVTAAELINGSSWMEIADILYKFGEERHSRAIARAIVAGRPVTTTSELADIVSKAAGPRRREKIHPATRTFQALRIAINDELGRLKRVLPQIPALLRPGGRIAVIAFHSLEDRVVKQWMRAQSRRFRPDPTLPAGGQAQDPILSLCNRKPIVPTASEIERNPRSRSAKLRVAELL